MPVEQFDIEVSNDCVARVVTQGERYVLYAIHPALRPFDGDPFDSLAEAREAALGALDADASEPLEGA